MAGDWMKVELATADKPEVMRIASMLGVTRDDALGKLIRLWAWFDRHTDDGHARGVTPVTLDSLIGHTGFTDALASVGWIEVCSDGVIMPRFDRHNGKSAKKRALDADRQLRKRDKERDALRDAQRDDSVTREEKRRDKENKAPTAPPNGGSTVWDFGKFLLVESGLSLATAGSLIGSWLKEWDEPTVAAALRSAAGKGDPKSYVLGVLAKKPKKAALGEMKLAI